MATLDSRGVRLNTVQAENGQLVFRGTVAHPGMYSVACRCAVHKTTHITNIYLPSNSGQLHIDLDQNLLPAIYQKLGLGTYDSRAYLRDTRLFSTANFEQALRRFSNGWR